jgi:hypothetical protein
MFKNKTCKIVNATGSTIYFTIILKGKTIPECCFGLINNGERTESFSSCYQVTARLTNNSI